MANESIQAAGSPIVGTSDEKPPAVQHVVSATDVETAMKPVNFEDAAFIPVGGLTMSEEERKLDRRVNRKFDFLVLPLLVILFVFDGMDKNNVGNAATVNFLATAHLSKNAVNNAASLLFVTFVPLQPVSAAFGKWIGVTRWMPIVMFVWGMLTISNAFVKSDGQFYAIRILLGACEAGFFPMCMFYISTLYPRFWLGRRLAIFYGSNTFAGCFSGLIAYAILQWENKPLYSWQYLFIVEGACTALTAILAFFWLPSDAGAAWFLTAKEKEWAGTRMMRDSAHAHQAARGITKQDLIEVLRDWKIWLIIPGNMFASVIYQAFNVFLPLIVENLGYTSYRANLFTVPIYFVGAIGLIGAAFSSDHFKERTIHLLCALAIVIFGSILVVTLKSNVGRYVALCIMNIGTYTQTPLVNASLMNNTPNPNKRVLVVGFSGLGNVGGVIAAQLFRPKFQPTYHIPFYVALAMSVLGWFFYFSYRMGMIYHNKKRAAIIANWTPEEIEEENTNDVRLGDKKYTFVYTL
ncbi:hypothetical protein SBRCBS47491_001552 [Sporothrix bragantina]|uniref:Major facilitator superfamily (MFS) profile domain-containing protein n=1 Tax=Sporothrix bragantina TaxID=671064 RepID=A0ABP0AZS9_9PEZI